MSQLTSPGHPGKAWLPAACAQLQTVVPGPLPEGLVPAQCVCLGVQEWKYLCKQLGKCWGRTWPRRIQIPSGFETWLGFSDTGTMP